LRLFRSLLLLVLALGLQSRLAAADDARMVPAESGTPARPAIFGAREIYSPDLSAFIKWTGMLERFEREEREEPPCAADAMADCAPGEWRELLGELAGLDLKNKLDRVNAAINGHPYVASMRNWGESNRWETPFEFLRRGGQCQDYAIAKYLLLRAAGVPAAALRIVVLHDTRLGLDHAVMVAYVEGRVLMLDNQLASVVPADGISHYQPYYSINEEGWWLHLGPNARYAAADFGGRD
jgi:predicted transglutaminase-like cysteine proteinase